MLLSSFCIELFYICHTLDMNKNLDETHRDISEHDIETNLNATRVVIEKFPDGHDYDEKEKHQKNK